MEIEVASCPFPVTVEVKYRTDLVLSLCKKRELQFGCVGKIFLPYQFFLFSEQLYDLPSRMTFYIKYQFPV